MSISTMYVEPVLIERSRFKMIGLFGLSVLMAVGSIAIAWVAYRDEGSGSFHFLIGLIGTVFFGFGAVVLAKRAFDTEPAIEFHAEGLLARDVSTSLIRWTDIRSVRMIAIKGQRFIELIVDPEAEACLELSRITRWSRQANAALGVHGLALATTGLRSSVDEVMAMIIQRAEQAQAENTRQ